MSLKLANKLIKMRTIVKNKIKAVNKPKNKLLK